MSDAADAGTILITTGLPDKERLLGKMSSVMNFENLIGKE
jgi:hypothetical protein